MPQYGQLHQEYLDKRSTVRPIKANNKNLDDILRDEVQHFGYNADLNHIDVSNVTDMNNLFIGEFYDVNDKEIPTPARNISLFNGDISRWDVSNVRDMSWLFFYSLFNGDISNWKTDKLESMHHMFHTSCFNKDISKWNVSNVSRYQSIFKGARFSGDISKWNIKKLDTLCELFIFSDFTGDINDWLTIRPDLKNQNDYRISIAPFAQKETIKADDSNIHSIVAEEIQKYGVTANMNHIDVSRVTDMSGLFYRPELLRHYPNNDDNIRIPGNFMGNISEWDVSNVRNMDSMFEGSMFNGDISKWELSQVLSANSIFKDSSFNQDLTSLAKKYKNLSTLMDSHIDKRKIKAENDSLKDIVTEEIDKYGNNANLNHIDVSRVTDMSGLFENSLFNGDISKWNVAKVKNMDRMFAHTEFNGDISNWNVKMLDSMTDMFNTSCFKQNLSKWQVMIDHTVLNKPKNIGARKLHEGLGF